MIQFFFFIITWQLRLIYGQINIYYKLSQDAYPAQYESTQYICTIMEMNWPPIMFSEGEK